jgi:hypothetical protein
MMRAMSTRTAQRFSRHGVRPGRRLAWVLVIALLLPFAQALAWSHALSHHGSLRADSAATGSYDAACATCLAAAPLHGGALPTAPAIVAAPPLQHAHPTPARALPQRRDVALAYHSRAPPAAC